MVWDGTDAKARPRADEVIDPFLQRVVDEIIVAQGPSVPPLYGHAGLVDTVYLNDDTMTVVGPWAPDRDDAAFFGSGALIISFAKVARFEVQVRFKFTTAGAPKGATFAIEIVEHTGTGTLIDVDGTHMAGVWASDTAAIGMTNQDVLAVFVIDSNGNDAITVGARVDDKINSDWHIDLAKATVKEIP